MNFIPASEFFELFFVAIQQTEKKAASFLFVLLILFSDIDDGLCGRWENWRAAGLEHE